MKKTIVILGAGPRGLAMALRACLYKQNFQICIVDKTPLNTWKFPNMLPDLQMRSPITFDLVTYQKDLQRFSLAHYLNHNIPFTKDQKEIEANQDFCSRKEFVNYLNYVKDYLLNQGCIFVQHYALSIKKDCVILTNGRTLEFDYLVVALGAAANIPNVPSFLRNKDINYVTNICECGWKDQEVNVVGSGQQSAEVVHYLLTQKAKVTWLQKKEPIVNQYPVPSYKQWGIGSALSDHYQINKYKDEYLRKVKEWGPSITPDIANKLSNYKYQVLQPTSTKDFNCDAKFVLASGFKPDVNILPFTFDLTLDKNNTCFPKLDHFFSLYNNYNIFFSGLLALRYDGPRQGSIISAGETARLIIDCILQTEKYN